MAHSSPTISTTSTTTSQTPNDITSLRASWKTLYAITLPSLARRRSSVQSHWPVFLDHCFARIILDNAVGKTRPWTEVVQSPAVQNMTAVQLQSALELGEGIARGNDNLDALNRRSLALRGKKAPPPSLAAGRKRKKEDEEAGDSETPEDDEKKGKNPRKGEVAAMWARYTAKQDGGIRPVDTTAKADADRRLETETKTTQTQPSQDQCPNDNNTKKQKHIPQTTHASLAAVRTQISSHPTLTPFRKLILTLLTQVPRGRFTTYKALSDAAAKSAVTKSNNVSGKGCARAIGGAMRDNPFAPQVPCHRVMASDKKIGGFKGDWGDEGRFVQEKRRLLREEGVQFDDRGRVKGDVFVDFVM